MALMALMALMVFAFCSTAISYPIDVALGRTP
jgi:hypothetical protein